MSTIQQTGPIVECQQEKETCYADEADRAAYSGIVFEARDSVVLPGGFVFYGCSWFPRSIIRVYPRKSAVSISCLSQNGR